MHTKIKSQSVQIHVFRHRTLHEQLHLLHKAQRRGHSEFYQNFSELQLEKILAEHVQKAVLGVYSAEDALQLAPRLIAKDISNYDLTCKKAV